MSPLERLQLAGELHLVRGSWCAPTPGKTDDWYEVLSGTQGLLLLSEGLAVYRDRRLRPAPQPAGGE